MSKILYKDRIKLTKDASYHIIFWAIFIAYEINVTLIMSGYSTHAPLMNYLSFYAINIALFYSHSLLVLDKNLKSVISAIWRLPLFTALELVVYFTLTLVSSIILSKKSLGIVDLKLVTSLYTVAAIWRAIYFLLLATGYHIFKGYVKRKENALKQAIDNEKLKNELLQAEQDFLRAQINPHLLFNTLSFIKYAAKKKPEEADEAVMRLSEIMGFALENNSETILLIKELEQVENIIGLNQLRFNHTLQINYTVEIADEKTTIIPIIILTLVENIFKHGNLMDENFPAQIKIESTSDYLLVKTSNLPNLNHIKRSNQTGLANINSRLDQFYRNNYSFSYGTEEGIFKAEVKINLTGNLIT